ncbi:MAG: hypothetical protein ACRDZ9_04680 [Acidimicrobiales bacterium]
MTITQDDIRQLACFESADFPVTTCYLNVDGADHLRHHDVVDGLARLLRDARTRGNGNPSVAADLRRIEDHVKGGFDRSHTRGLAFFSCSARGLWRVVELPVPVRSEMVFNHTPCVRQLEGVMDEYERFGVLLADRQRARMLVFELGELVESDHLFDRLPRGDDDDRSYTKDRARSHASALAHQHLRHAAEVAFAVFKERGFERLIIGAADDVAAELEAMLHPYLRERLEARGPIPINAGDEEIRRSALAVEATVERRKEAEVVDRLRQALGSGHRGVAGLEATLPALVERRVDTLLVSEGYAEPGWRCDHCGWLGRVGRSCPACVAVMRQVEDVVEEAIEDALGQSCRVEMCVGNADLDVLGGIGALLRY